MYHYEQTNYTACPGLCSEEIDHEVMKYDSTPNLEGMVNCDGTR